MTAILRPSQVGISSISRTAMFHSILITSNGASRNSTPIQSSVTAAEPSAILRTAPSLKSQTLTLSFTSAVRRKFTAGNVGIKSVNSSALRAGTLSMSLRQTCSAGPLEHFRTFNSCTISLRARLTVLGPIGLKMDTPTTLLAIIHSLCC